MTIDDSYDKAQETNDTITKVEGKIDNILSIVDKYAQVIDPIPITITLSDGITTVDNIKKSSDKISTQVDNFLSNDNTKIVTYSDNSTDVNLKKMAEETQIAIQTTENELATSGNYYIKTEIDSKPLGWKNILLNSKKLINQRDFSGDWSTLNIGEYGWDRWKKVDDNNMAQIIEETNFIPNTNS